MDAFHDVQKKGKTKKKVATTIAPTTRNDGVGQFLLSFFFELVQSPNILRIYSNKSNSKGSVQCYGHTAYCILHIVEYLVALNGYTFE